MKDTVTEIKHPMSLANEAVANVTEILVGPT